MSSTNALASPIVDQLTICASVSSIGCLLTIPTWLLRVSVECVRRRWSLAGFVSARYPQEDVLCTFSRAANLSLALMRLPSQARALAGDSVTTMRTLRHPIAMFFVAVLVVIGIGVGVLALSGARLQPAATLQTPASILALAKLGTQGLSPPSISSAAGRRTPRTRSRRSPSRRDRRQEPPRRSAAGPGSGRTGWRPQTAQTWNGS